MLRFDFIATAATVAIGGLVLAVILLRPAEIHVRQFTDATKSTDSSLAVRIIKSSGAADWLLVLVAVGTGYVAVRSLRHIGEQAAANAEAAKAAKESNEINRAILVADQRPWIGIDVSIHGAVEPHPGTPNAWRVQVGYVLKHAGKSPAVDVTVYMKLVPFLLHRFAELPQIGKPMPEVIKGTDIERELESACWELPDAPGLPKFGFSRTLFPGEEQPGRWSLPFPLDDGADVPPNYTGQFLVVCGVTYRSALNPSYRYKDGKGVSAVQHKPSQVHGRECPSGGPATGVEPFPWKHHRYLEQDGIDAAKNGHLPRGVPFEIAEVLKNSLNTVHDGAD